MKKYPEGSPQEEAQESPAKERKEEKAGKGNKGKSYDHLQGKEQNPADHPMNNLPPQNFGQQMPVQYGSM